ncbi:MAG: DEAD/DEAH box helicase family protein [Candidatus Melainabacteria bacterium]|nr:DEAD/DEAH box helicase family protein [Candidatus Melainabacteria bacterium]
MTFKTLDLKTTYCSTSVDLYKDVVAPLLEGSVRYDRAVGFFSSLWLKEVALGLAHFVANKGKARIVTSVKLSERDWAAIKNGSRSEDPEALIELKISEAIDSLKASFEHRTLGALSWLVANDVLDFRFSVPIGRLDGGILHSKLALFYDKDNSGVAVFGSQNDSAQANVNEETISIFTSWGVGKDYFEDYKTAFEEKWNGNNSSIRTFGISEAARRNIIMVGENFQQLFCGEVGLQESQQDKKSRKLRDYQEVAIDAWFNNDCQGLFEMATGSGKTFTSISAAMRLLETQEQLAVVVVAPYTHLVEQWANELREFGFNPVVCAGGYAQWQPSANKKLLEFKAGITKTLCLVCTHSTASNEKFIEFTERLPGSWLLIADEVHGLGASKFRNALFESAKFRIGLSATAARWFDDEGTAFVRNYFRTTVIEYGLKEGIEEGSLTQYGYFPVLVELSHDELEEYSKLCKQIFMAVSKGGVDDEHTQHLLRKRARLLGAASLKLPTLLNLVREHQIQCQQYGIGYIHNLFYCSPGEHEEVVSALSSIGLKVHKFVYDVPQNVRNDVLKAFAIGDLDGIVAIKCLDEGVDIPATTRAYILASTTNPREFVQRRGRLLRNYPGKVCPELYDFVIGPWGHVNDYSEEVAKSLLRRELPRIVEFNSLSRSKHTATQDVYAYCKNYGMEEFLYMEPWEVYQAIQAAHNGV